MTDLEGPAARGPHRPVPRQENRAARVLIHYLRPPDREQVFDQRVVHERGDVIVTLAESIAFGEPLRVGGSNVLEAGSDVVWFTFPGAWHDIGRFHRSDGTFTGFYANVLTPCEIDGRTWRTTDLFLDVWSGADGRVELLDEDELDQAVAVGHVDEALAERAREEGARLIRAAAAGTWPPAVVHEWTLARARAAVG